MTDANLRQYDWLQNVGGFNSEEADALIKQKKIEAWQKLSTSFPNADLSKFKVEAVFYSKTHVEATVYFAAGEGLQQSVFGSDRKYWSNAMKKALGVGSASGGFPIELQALQSSEKAPIPAIDFNENAASLKKVFSGIIDVHVAPDMSFETKFRDIFTGTRIKHTSAAEAEKWLSGPNIAYWPQMLNFAVWCATTGSGISRQIFDKRASELNLPPQVYSFYLFHVYFTVRRILFQLGGIQRVSALPGDKTFNEKGMNFDKASYKRICAEFGLDPSSDFRYTKPKNNGLGGVYVYGPGGAFEIASQYPGGSAKFAGEGGSAKKGNLIYFVRPDASAEDQADWFCPKNSEGLSQAGLSRINQSIEAFVYCVLGAQVNVRSSIIGSGGRAKEAQSEFLVLLEDAIIQPDLAKSVARYQLAIDQAKVRLNFAVCPGAWLMPGSMIINTETAVGYNNQLKQASGSMRLGINNQVNTGTKKVGVPVGESKINHPNSHSSNPVHRNQKQKVSLEKDGEKEDPPKPHNPHEENKFSFAIGAVFLAGAFVLMTR